MSSSFKRRGKKASVRPSAPAAAVGGASTIRDGSAVAAESSSSLLSSTKSTNINEHERIQPSQSQRSTNITTSSSVSTTSMRKNTISSSLLPGTKPWTNNLTLTSFGLREIDSFFFSSSASNSTDNNNTTNTSNTTSNSSNSGSSGGGGGGQPLQTFVLIEEDRLSDDLGRALARYWVAEGVAQKQMVLMPCLLPCLEDSLDLMDIDNHDRGGIGGGGYNHMNIHHEGSTPEELQDFVMSLPRNLHLDKFREKMKRAQKKNKNKNEPGQSDSSHSNNEGMNMNRHREAIGAIIEEGEDEDEERDENENDTEQSQSQQQSNATNKDKDEGLVNAWQYRKSIQDERSGIFARRGSSSSKQRSSKNGGDGVYCHSYDLSKRMWDQYQHSNKEDAGDTQVDVEEEKNPLLTHVNIVNCSTYAQSYQQQSQPQSTSIQQQGMKLFSILWKALQSTINAHPNTVIRLFLHRLPVNIGSITMPLLLAKIRKENLPVVLLATIRPWRYLSSTSSSSSSTSSSVGNTNNNNKLDTLSTLRTITDLTLSLDSFSSLRSPPPPEFTLLQGILTVRKCAPFTSSSYYTDSIAYKQRPLAERFGIKRDGRKVMVQLLHLPPEEYSKGGSSTSGVRSGGGNANAGGGVDNGKNASFGSGSSSSSHVHKHGAGGCSSLALGGGGGSGASLDF